MDLYEDFFLYATVFRVAVVAAGVLIIVLGYRLFVRGVVSQGGTDAEAQGGTDAEAQAGGFQLTIKNAAPGTCFALFGAVMITVIVVEGSPQLDVQNSETMQRGDAPYETTSAVRLRGESGEAFEAFVRVGIEREKAGDEPGALAAYNRALSLAAEPLNQIAWIYQRQDKLDEALPLARLAVQINPDAYLYMDTLAQVLLKRGEHEEALNWARRAIDLAPNHPELLHTLALCLEAVGAPQEALDIMRQAASKDPYYASEVELLRSRIP